MQLLWINLATDSLLTIAWEWKLWNPTLWTESLSPKTKESCPWTWNSGGLAGTHVCSIDFGWFWVEKMLPVLWPEDRPWHLWF